MSSTSHEANETKKDHDDQPNLRHALSTALEQISWGRFQQYQLLPITGLTLMADAMELMLLPFLTLGVQCEWGTAAGGSTAAITDVESSFLSTAVFIGMLFGAIFSGLCSDRIGRRPTVLLVTGLTGIFGLVSALATSFPMLLFSRGMVGVGVGGSPAALSLFTEFLPKDKRGQYLVHYMCYFSGGAVLEVVLAWLILNRFGWRWLLFVSCLPALVLMVLVWFYLPESASWLLSRGQRRQATQILQHAFQVNHPHLVHKRVCPLYHKQFQATTTMSYQPIEDHPSEMVDSSPLIPCQCANASATSLSSATAIIVPTTPTSINVVDQADELNINSVSIVRPSSPSSFMQFFRPLLLVFSPSLRAMSSLLCLLFFLMAFVYYGLVLMSINLVQDQQQHELKECTLRNDQYFQLFTANLAEFPGLFLCFLLLDRIGRRLTITYMFLATAAFTAMIPILWFLQTCDRFVLPPPTNPRSHPHTSSPRSISPVHSTTPETSPADMICPLGPVADWLQSVLLFGARACSLAFNQALWIYTTELYPAQVRSSGLGLTTVFARIGGGVSPWICQWLYWRSRYIAVYSCVVAACVAGMIAAYMPKDTHGMELEVKLAKESSASSDNSNRKTTSARSKRSKSSRSRDATSSSTLVTDSIIDGLSGVGLLDDGSSSDSSTSSQTSSSLIGHHSHHSKSASHQPHPDNSTHIAPSHHHSTASSSTSTTSASLVSHPTLNLDHILKSTPIDPTALSISDHQGHTTTDTDFSIHDFGTHDIDAGSG